MRFLLPLSFGLVTLGGTALAQDATLSVLHGIPGLPAPAEIWVNNSKLLDFGYGEIKGPLSLKPDTYLVEVKVQSQTVLSAKPTLAAGKSYAGIAHLKAGSGIQLSLYENDLSPIASGKARVSIRHTAQAPAVDVYVATSPWAKASKLVSDLSNPDQATAVVDARRYYVYLTPAGKSDRVFRTYLSLVPGIFYGVYAVGEVGQPSFRLLVQALDLVGTPKLAGFVRGKACGGAIGISTQTPAFDQPFQVTLTGGTKSGFGLFHAGDKDSRLLFIKLPLALDFLGLGGCTLYQNTPMIWPVMLDGDGKATRSITLPGSMARSFGEMHFQYSFLAPGKNSLGLLLTDYASVERAQ